MYKETLIRELRSNFKYIYISRTRRYIIIDKYREERGSYVVRFSNSKYYMCLVNA